jgi:hypothetical protein
MLGGRDFGQGGDDEVTPPLKTQKEMTAKGKNQEDTNTSRQLFLVQKRDSHNAVRKSKSDGPLQVRW